jgi:hypothetical protein
MKTKKKGMPEWLGVVIAVLFMAGFIWLVLWYNAGLGD